LSVCSARSSSTVTPLAITRLRMPASYAPRLLADTMMESRRAEK
jgi:hypothetical protein